MEQHVEAGRVWQKYTENGKTQWKQRYVPHHRRPTLVLQPFFVYVYIGMLSFPVTVASEG